MGRTKLSHWAQEAELEEVFKYSKGEEENTYCDKIYEAVTRFHQKEQRRKKPQKSQKLCWQ